jgi:hypothetical protein
LLDLTGAGPAPAAIGSEVKLDSGIAGTAIGADTRTPSASLTDVERTDTGSRASLPGWGRTTFDSAGGAIDSCSPVGSEAARIDPEWRRMVVAASSLISCRPEISSLGSNLPATSTGGRSSGFSPEPEALVRMASPCNNVASSLVSSRDQNPSKYPAGVACAPSARRNARSFSASADSSARHCPQARTRSTAAARSSAASCPSRSSGSRLRASQQLIRVDPFGQW